MKSTKLTVSLVLLMLSPFAKALPVKNPSCAKNIRVQEIEGGSGSFFNEDCSVLYVLPPLFGDLQVTGYVAPANLNELCAQYRDIDEDRKNLQQTLTLSSRRLADMQKELNQIDTNLREGLLPVGQSRESLEARYKQLLKDSADLRDTIDKMQNQADNRRLAFSKAQAGRGNFTISNSYARLLNDYRSANPSIASIQAMPIDQSYLSVNEQLSDDDIDVSSMPAVKRLIVPGVGEMPLLLDPKILMAHKELVPAKSPLGSKIFNGSMSGEIRLTSIGACDLAKAVGNATSFNATDFSPYIAANATYSYQLQVTRKHSITYNLQKLIQIIHEQTTRNGFFSTSTLDSVTDTRRVSEWIQFNVESQDSRYEYTDEYVREVKKEFLDRALAQIVSIQSDSATPLLSLIAPSRNGASVAGDELGKCPHVYCQIGAGGLKVLSSIFGSSSAVSKLFKTVDGDMKETVTEKRMVPAYGTYTFH